MSGDGEKSFNQKKDLTKINEPSDDKSTLDSSATDEIEIPPDASGVDFEPLDIPGITPSPSEQFSESEEDPIENKVIQSPDELSKLFEKSNDGPQFDSFPTDDTTDRSTSPVFETEDFPSISESISKNIQTDIDTPKLPERSFEPLPAEPDAGIPDPVDSIREESENASSTKAYVAPSEPFSVLIHGKLNELDQAKLISIVTEENLGIREVDLDPQFEAGKVLIPRVSEFSGILIVQALRDAPVSMTIGPASEVYASPEDTKETKNFQKQEAKLEVHTSQELHPAIDIPLIPSSKVPGLDASSQIQVLDGVTASLRLETHSVEAENSMEYTRGVESLQRTLKYKAFRLGAKAVIHFKINLIQLKNPNQYQISAFGTAVKF